MFKKSIVSRSRQDRACFAIFCGRIQLTMTKGFKQKSIRIMTFEDVLMFSGIHISCVLFDFSKGEGD